MSSEFAKSQPNTQPEAPAENLESNLESIDWMMLAVNREVSPAPAESKAAAPPQAPEESESVEDISWFLLSEKPTAGVPTVMQVQTNLQTPSAKLMGGELELPDLDSAILDNFDLDFASTPQDFGLDLPDISDSEALLDLPAMELPAAAEPELEDVATSEEAIAPIVAAEETSTASAADLEEAGVAWEEAIEESIAETREWESVAGLEEIVDEDEDYTFDEAVLTAEAIEEETVFGVRPTPVAQEVDPFAGAASGVGGTPAFGLTETDWSVGTAVEPEDPFAETTARDNAEWDDPFAAMGGNVADASTEFFAAVYSEEATASYTEGTSAGTPFPDGAAVAAADYAENYTEDSSYRYEEELGGGIPFPGGAVPESSPENYAEDSGYTDEEALGAGIPFPDEEGVYPNAKHEAVDESTLAAAIPPSAEDDPGLYSENLLEDLGGLAPGEAIAREREHDTVGEYRPSGGHSPAALGEEPLSSYEVANEYADLALEEGAYGDFSDPSTTGLGIEEPEGMMMTQGEEDSMPMGATPASPADTWLDSFADMELDLTGSVFGEESSEEDTDIRPAGSEAIAPPALPPLPPLPPVGVKPSAIAPTPASISPSPSGSAQTPPKVQAAPPPSATPTVKMPPNPPASPKVPPAAASTPAKPAPRPLSSLPADAFDMDDNDMEWTQLLDADTEFLKEVSSLQTMGKTLPSTRPTPPPALRSPAPSVSKPQSSPRAQVRPQSLEEEEEAQVAAMAPAKAQGMSLEDFWPKLKVPVLALGGVAVAGGAIAFLLSPVVQRPLTVTSLRLGWAKDVQGRDLTGVNLQKAKLAGVNFAEANLQDANLAGADLRRSNLMGANLRGTNLQKANLRGAQVRGAQIELNKKKNETRLDSEDLLLWSLSNTNRPGRAVTRQNLDGFNLAGATLGRVNFTGSRLTWVDFTGADLSGVNFSNTTLTGANFQGANLRGARFTGATWDNRPNFAPRTNKDTTCPNGRPGPCTLL